MDRVEKLISETLPDSAKDKLSLITARIKRAKESIDRIPKPENKHSPVGIFLTILLMPVLFLLFAGALVLAIWFMQNPLDTTAMLGISIALIGGYVILSNKKKG